MRVLLAASAMLALVPVVAQDDAAPRFAWPAGARAEVAIHLSGNRAVPAEGRKATWDLTSSYTLTVEAREGGLRVRRGDLAPWTGKGTGPVVDRIADLVPAVLLTPAGEFEGIEGAEIAARKVRKIMTGELPEPAIASVSAADGLRAAQQDYWGILVEAWDGFQPDEGVTLLTQTVPVPQLGGGDLTLHLEMRRTPAACEPADEAKRCVEFRLVSRPDKPMVEKLLGGVGVRLSAYDMSQEVRVITDAATLLPRTATFWRWMEIAEKGSKGPPVPQTEEATRTYTFRWTLPSASLPRR